MLEACLWKERARFALKVPMLWQAKTNAPTALLEPGLPATVCQQTHALLVLQPNQIASHDVGQ